MDYVVLIIGFIYLGIFAFIIIFDISVFASQKHEKDRLNKKCLSYYHNAKAFLVNKNMSAEDKQRYMHKVSKKLTRHTNLVAFSVMLKDWNEKNPEECRRYMHCIGGIFPVLVKKYEHRMRLSKVYFAYFLSHHDYDESLSMNEKVNQFLLELCADKSFYTRDNALKSFVRFGNISAIVKCLELFTEHHLINNPQVTTKNLRMFKGNPETLIDALLEKFADFDPAIKMGIINYMNVTSDNYCEVVLNFITTYSGEYGVVLACLRYLKAHPYEDALPTMLELGNKSYEEGKFGYVAAAANALGPYPSWDTVDFLLKAVSCPYYYARKCASDSLLNICPNRAFTIVKELNDTKANEMLQYRNNEMKLIEEQEASRWK